MAGQAEWTWQLEKTNRCVVISFPGQLSWFGNEAFFRSLFLYSHTMVCKQCQNCVFLY